ncbi:hypothetical protein N0V95_005801, partial [Ascochyta clinopodiicola]
MQISPRDAECSMILVMGVTGSGKSYFINKLAQGAVAEGHKLRSKTTECQVVRVGIGRQEVALVDTPGFDDTARSDAEILEEIVQFLCTQYELGIPLKGIIYMHRITDNRMTGSAQRYFEMFMKLCGDQNMENVVLLTTMWGELRDEAKGLQRERELRKEFWKAMEKNGSTIRRFDASRSMAEAFVCRLMRKEDIVLDIQDELVKEGRSELIKSNMQMTAVQANTIPHSDVRSEDGTRKSKSVSKLGADVQRKRAIGRPVVTSKSSNIGPPVPPHTSSLNSAAKAPGDDNVARTQPSITRKPTQTEDSVNGHAEAREKQLPLLNPTIGAGSTLSQEISKTNIIDRELRPQGLETNEQSGPTLGQTFEEQTWKTQEQVRDMKALQDTNYQHVVEIKKLKDELQKESDSHAKTTQAWRKATASLSAHRQETNYKVDDDALRSHFHNIIYDVEGWVSTHCLLKFEHLSESDLRIFGALTPKPSKYYHVKRTRELLLQSLVMHDLAHLVLNRLWWAGKLSDNLCTVQYAMEP